MNILITSAGRRTYLVRYFQQALAGKGEVHVANSNQLSPAFLVADHTVVTPLIYDAEYIPFLLNYCREHAIDAVISLFDIDLPVLAHHRDAFAQIGVRLLISDAAFVDICNDKWESSRFLEAHGFLTPKTYLTVQAAREAIASGALHYPLIIKPRWGNGTLQFYEAENEAELELLYEKSKRGVLRTYLKHESNADIDHCILIQEKLNGQEYGLDVVNDLDGNYQTTIVKKKCAMRSGETDCAVVQDCPKLKQLGASLSAASHHIANLDVDIFMVDQQPYVLEMNARFGGGYPFSHLAGVDIPRAIVAWLNGEPAQPQWLQETVGVIGQKDISMVRLDG